MEIKFNRGDRVNAGVQGSGTIIDINKRSNQFLVEHDCLADQKTLKIWYSPKLLELTPKK